MSKTLCIYHGNCQDGFGAAWVVRKRLGDSAEFHPGIYQDAPPDVTGRDVLLVDFSYKRPVLEELARTARSVLVLDHHKSAAEDLTGFFSPPSWDIWTGIAGTYPPMSMRQRITALFDMERSGTGITWDYFYPDEPRPRLIDHIEDRDLWRFKLPNTRMITAALLSHPYDFDLWDHYMSSDLKTLTLEGAAIERKHHQDIDNLLPVVQRGMVIGGAYMPVACLPLTLTSDAGHKMASAANGVAACYWDTKEGRVFSLRSTENGPDVSAIAKQYGGGGHPHAAGFRAPLGWEGDAATATTET
jgi:oligoribonuclease NrnB/cAMP/cGMP phosphodiesterase (DHH superfamily)